MGKYKPKRFSHKEKNNPTGLPSVKESERVEAELVIEPSTAKATEQSTLQNLLEELQSGDEDNRLRALLGISCLGDVELDKNAVKTIAPMLLDHSPSVQMAAANALRMLVLSGGSPMADLMVTDDLMTPLAALLRKQSEDLFSAKPKEKDVVKNEIFISALRLLWCLCENSESVLPLVNSMDVLSILLTAVQSSDRDLAIPAAQCLQTISEDNPKAVAFISKQQDHLITVLREESTDPAFVHLQCLIAGLVVNMHYGLVSRVLPATTGVIMAVLARCLSQDVAKLLGTTAEVEMAEEPEGPAGEENKEEEDEEEEEKAERQEKNKKASQQAVQLTLRVGHAIDSQICALEILANICTSEDDDEGMEVSESSEEGMSDPEGWEEDPSSTCQPLLLSPTLPVEVLEALLSHGLLAKTMNMTQSVSADLLTPLGSLAEEEGLGARLHKRQCNALLALHNLVRGLSLEELGGEQQLGEAWKMLASKIVSEWHSNAELLEAGTTSLRALITRLGEERSGGQLVSSLAPSDLQAFCSLAEKCKDANVRVDIFRVLASLCSIVSANFSEQTAPLLAEAGTFLLEQCGRETEVGVVAEALDALMDALSEDCSDQACADMKLVPKLQALVPSLQHKIRTNRRNLGAHLAVVTTVKSNLARFIKYKAKRLG